MNTIESNRSARINVKFVCCDKRFVLVPLFSSRFVSVNEYRRWWMNIQIGLGASNALR